MSDAILRVSNLDMHFGATDGWFGKTPPTVRAVDDVSFEVLRGETFGIVGESGSGKTTLGRCIIRTHTPTGGTVEFRGKGAEPVDLTASGPEQLRTVWRSIRMIFQDPQSSLNPRLPVIELVGQVLRKTEGLRGKELADRVADLLFRVGLRPEILHRYPGAFSGGQRQRLGIARALATNPELVIADESVSALDVSIQAQTLNLLQDLQESLNLTYIFIAHDLAVVEHICDRVAVMYRGQIVELAETGEIFERPRHPYSRALLNAVPIPDPRLRKERRGRKSLTDGDVTVRGCRFASRCSHATDLCRSEAPPRKRIGQTDVLCHFAGEV
ncbi:ABC transporter ATP-binding protein [Aliiruegeria sabulilitoris]|uniref:ABC transporter ATP-binding protein n=1 Tax=Aliiruegeria sabulilitoris TaxID=1510458 RepID=UPI000834236A|nr:ABC transporter ATP-binding protein [Aliiruegeria sabulilitoris]NDR55309.1 ABC transporter ATP-binding protein [Pseudoruegeria sp. M32A2M]